MRLFAVSDIHIDYQENKQWMNQLSSFDFREDVLLLGGDISDDIDLLHQCFRHLTECFAKVFFVPGNHDIWDPQKKYDHSIAKFFHLLKIAKEYGIATERQTLKMQAGKVAGRNVVAEPTSLKEIEQGVATQQAIETEIGIEIAPLYSWYDFSFGQPVAALERSWMDFHRCHWPDEIENSVDICDYFLTLNLHNLHATHNRIISFSHFLPRIDIMPARIPQKYRIVYPVLGCERLDRQVRQLGSEVHVYGHSHVQVDTKFDGVRYVNCALGYPNEFWLKKKLTLVTELQ